MVRSDKKPIAGVQPAVLPSELVFEILTWLPGKPLCRSKCVCKPWRSMIRSRPFMEAYRKRQYGVLLYQSEEIKPDDGVVKCRLCFFHCPFGRLLKSLEEFSPLLEMELKTDDNSQAIQEVTQMVDGLLCVVDEGEKDSMLSIHNICTGEMMKVSNPLPSPNTNQRFYLMYDPATNTYKLLRLLFSNRTNSLQGAHIMDLRLPSPFIWRVLDCHSGLNLNELDLMVGLKQTSNNDGVLCWFAVRDDRGKLLCFDSSRERFWFVEFPRDVNWARNMMAIDDITRFKDRLALWASSKRESNGGNGGLTCYVQEDDDGKNWKIMKKYEESVRLDIVLAAGNSNSNGEILVMNMDKPQCFSSYSLQQTKDDAEYDQAVFSVGKVPHGALAPGFGIPHPHGGSKLWCFIEGNNLHLPLSDIFGGALLTT